MADRKSWLLGRLKSHAQDLRAREREGLALEHAEDFGPESAILAKVHARAAAVYEAASLAEIEARDAGNTDALAASTCAGVYPGTIRDLVHRLEVCVAEEQEQTLPRNHFIAVFCDVIRYMRDEGRRPFAEARVPASATTAGETRGTLSRLADRWREIGTRLTNIRELPGPAPESIAYYQCAEDLERALDRPT